MTPLPHIPLPYEYIDPRGVKWHPYEVIFDTPEGEFGMHLYAINDEHAAAMLQDLKETGRISGQTINQYSEFKEPDEE